MRFSLLSLSVPALLAAVIGFSGSASAERPVLNVGGVDGPGGSVKGVVKFAGEKANRRAVPMTADPFCNRAHTEPVLAEVFVFGDNDTLQNVFVYVSKGLEGKTLPPVPAGKAVLDQVGCVYIPHVMGVVANQELEILNSDSTLHNVKIQPKTNPASNDGMPVKGMKLSKRFATPEMGIEFKCDVHAWMTAYVHVMPHPYFAVTQQDGTFEIRGLPAGKYEVTVWHAFRRFAPEKGTIEVEVVDDAAAEITFTYDLAKRGS